MSRRLDKDMEEVNKLVARMYRISRRATHRMDWESIPEGQRLSFHELRAVLMKERDQVLIRIGDDLLKESLKG